MPVENERKYVLRVCSDLENRLAKAADRVYFIDQGYLHCGKALTVRLRRQRDRRGKVKHILTVKRKTAPGRVIEIEKKISAADYGELVPGAVGWLFKARYIVDSWDVDFFKSGTETYFVMAEIEMPDGMAEPSGLPAFVQDHLLYQVPREDCRFSSKKLSDLQHAKAMLAAIDQPPPPGGHQPRRN